MNIKTGIVAAVFAMSAIGFSACSSKPKTQTADNTFTNQEAAVAQPAAPAPAEQPAYLGASSSGLSL